MKKCPSKNGNGFMRFWTPQVIVFVSGYILTMVVAGLAFYVTTVKAIDRQTDALSVLNKAVEQSVLRDEKQDDRMAQLQKENQAARNEIRRDIVTQNNSLINAIHTVANQVTGLQNEVRVGTNYINQILLSQKRSKE